MWRRKSLSHVQLFCDPIGCSPPGSSVHGILRGKNTGVGCHFLLQGIFPTTDWIGVSHIAGRFFTIWATGKPRSYVSQLKSLRAEKIKKLKKSHRPQWRLRPQVLQLRRWAARLSLKIGKKTADTGGALKTEYKLFSHSVVSEFFVTPWAAAHQASLSITTSQNLLKLMSTNNLILCRPLLLLPSVFPRNRVEVALL